MIRGQYINDRDKVSREALFALRYPTTEFWLRTARIAYREGMTTAQLAEALKIRKEKPVHGGGFGVATNSVA